MRFAQRTDQPRRSSDESSRRVGPSFSRARVGGQQRALGVTTTAAASSSDGELLSRLSRGESGAYRDLFRRYERAAYRAALLMTRSHWDAEDVVASAFLELWRKRDNVRLVDGSMLPWLLTVASFAARNHLRATRRQHRLVARLPRDEDQPDHADDVASTVDSIPVAVAVQNALSGLSARDSRVLLLCVVHELSTRDAAAALGIAEGTVKSRLSRAKARLRSELREWAPGRRSVTTLSAPPRTADPEPVRTRCRRGTAGARSRVR